MRNGTALDDKFDEIKQFYDQYDKGSYKKSNISEETFHTIYSGLGLLGKSTDPLNDFIEMSPENYDKNSYRSIKKIYVKVKFYYENPANIKEILNICDNDLIDRNKLNFLRL